MQVLRDNLIAMLPSSETFFGNDAEENRGLRVWMTTAPNFQVTAVTAAGFDATQYGVPEYDLWRGHLLL